MSGLIVFAFAGALLQQSAPHPSTQVLYQAPAIRPFEPNAAFGRENAQGDGEESQRRPLDTPVSVDAYARSYEFLPGNVETAYNRGVTSAERRVDQNAGPLDGSWRVADDRGHVLFGLVMSDPRGGAAEGGWRGPDGYGVATAAGRSVTLEGLGVLTLEPHGGGWRGSLAANGRSRPVTVTRPD
ncbi:MAG: hypothetical protein EON85_04865 [Brevundimonas sp.]|nr:MAG: hypothetical protein EON85_04865 [Brevundimonas sp.]